MICWHCRREYNTEGGCPSRAPTHLSPITFIHPSIAFPRMRSYGLCPGSPKQQTCSSPAPPAPSSQVQLLLPYSLPRGKVFALLHWYEFGFLNWGEECRPKKKKSLKNVTVQVFCNQGQNWDAQINTIQDTPLCSGPKFPFVCVGSSGSLPFCHHHLHQLVVWFRSVKSYPQYLKYHKCYVHTPQHFFYYTHQNPYPFF